ncbi:MAG: Gfo/Idh/MocA family oxidoreductase [Candidatus Limnocylindria bacterium]
MSELAVALIGAGRAGLVHGRNFAAGIRGARLLAIADPDPDQLGAAAAELGVELSFADPLAAATHEAIDAVIIASPTFAHHGVALAALEAGKHVLCEKPIASTMQDAVAMADAAERSGRRTFLMGFMRRFDARFSRVAERIAAGDIGEPLYVRSTGRGPGLPPEWAWNPERSGGLVAEVNSHDIDCIRWLSGQEATRVYAVGRAGKRPDLAASHPGFVDLVAATIELSAGAVAHLDGACPSGYGYDARVEVYGTEGTILVGGPTEAGALLVRSGGAVMDPVRSWRTLFSDAYREEDRHFIAAALGQEEPRTCVQDGVAALRVAIAANRSMRTGQPVSIDEVAS